MKDFNFDLQRFKDISNKVSRVVKGTADDDYILNYGKKVTISGGDGNDSIENLGSTVTINGGKGDDYILNAGYCSNVTISGGDGNDSILNYGDNVTISGGASNDSIHNYGLKVTISGGKGDDTISNDNSDTSGVVYEYNSEDGNDVIVGFKSNDTLIINSTRKEITRKNDGDIILGVGNNSITIKDYTLVNHTRSDTAITGTSYADYIDNSGSNVTITSGGGNDTITNFDVYNVTISSGTGDDSINNLDSNNVMINGGAGNDSIHNWGENVTINGGNGNDYIFNDWLSDNVTINGGAGDDSIHNYRTDASINGGDGNDYILHEYEGYVTINGGTGDDTISLSGPYSLAVIEYAKGDGNDYVYGFQSSDTLIISGTTYSTSKSGKDVIVTAGSGKITLEGAASLSSIKIKGTVGGGSDTGSGGKDTTPGGKNISNAKASTLITGTTYADTIKNSAAQVTIQGGDGKDKISLSSGATKNVIIGGTGNDSIYSSVTSGVLYSYAKGDGNDYISGWSAKDTLTITGGAYKTSTTGNNVVVSITGGEKITLVGAKGKKVNINPSSTTTVSSSGKNISNTKASTLVSGTAYADTIKNSAAQVTIQGGDGKDKISITSAAKNNVIIGGLGNDSIYSSVTSGVLFKYAKGDGNDYISGWTAKDTLTITGGAYKTSTTGNNVVVSITGGEKITLVGAKGKKVNINPSSTTTVSSSGKNISNTKASTLVSGTAYADTIKNSAAQVTIQGGDGKDKISITSAAKNNVIVGGAGNDSIYSSVTSGVLYKYAKGDGNDYISSWTDKDTLTIIGGKFTTSTTGSNVVVSVTGGEKITLGGAKGKSININPSSTTTVSSSGKNISNTKASSLVSGTAYADTIKNSAAQVTIQGGDGKDKISITSAAKNNVIIGGLGNDSIYSSVTSGVLYSYAKGDGNDYIKGWTAKDTLTITGGKFTTSTTGSNVLVSIEGGEKITLVGAKGKAININPPNLNIDGTSGADKINNTLAGATINALAGDDTIINSGANVSIDAGAGADNITITSAANKNTVKGGKGNDTIDSSNENVMYLYASGDGNDVIYGFGNSTLNITSGSVSSASLNGDDVILKVGSSTITLKDQVDSEIYYKVGSGSVKSTVVGSENELVKEGTDIADTLSNKINQATISGLKGSDTITNYGHSVLISGGAGNDIISNFGTDVTIRGDADNDDITTSGNGTSINGGAGDDKISLSGDVSYATVMGGTGNDEIHLNDNRQLIQYKTGDGKDTIWGFGTGDSVQVTITSGKISGPMQRGSNVVFDISGTNDAITFRDNSSDNFKIENNVITFSRPEITTITGSSKPDSTLNNRSLAVINALEGNDTIKNTGSLVTIYGGAGNDVISLGGSAENNTIYGGTGNDVIYSNGNGNCIKYAADDGKDTVIGFGIDDSIEVTNGKISASVPNGEHMMFYIDDAKNVITIKDGASKIFKIEDNVISLYPSSDLLAMIDDTSEISYLLADNNFETGELQIDSITELSDVNYSVGKFENAEFVSNVTTDKISVEVTSALQTSADRTIFNKHKAFA